MQGRFDRIYTVELDEKLYERASKLFQDDPTIEVMQGDSTEVMPEILSLISTPAIFWLDAHASGGITARGEKVTPIREEVQFILDHEVRAHVILIDDARGFNGTNDYPSIDELREVVLNERPDWILEVANDVIRIHPPSGSD